MAGGPQLDTGSGGGSVDDDDDNDDRQRSRSQSSQPDRSAGSDDRLDAPGGPDTGAGDQKDRSNEPDQSAEADDRLEAPGGPDTSAGDGSTTPRSSSGTESKSSETTRKASSGDADQDDGLLDSAVDRFESGVKTARDIDQTARNRLVNARGTARSMLFSVTGEARESIQDRQRKGFKSTQETTADAMDILVGNERVVGDDVVGGPLPVFSAVGGRSAAAKGVQGAKGFVNAARGVEQGTIRGAATGGSAGSGGAARAAARHGEFVVKGVDNFVDGVRAASATAGAGVLAAADAEMDFPSDKVEGDTVSEVETPDNPSTLHEQAEIEVGGRETIHQSELGIPEDVDKNEIDVNGPSGTTITDNGEIQLPAEAAGVVVKEKMEEEEEVEEDDDNVVVEVPSELIPDGEVTIGGETDGDRGVEEVDGERFNEDFDKNQGDDFAETDATEVEEVDRELGEDDYSVVDNFFSDNSGTEPANERIDTSLRDRGDIDFTGGHGDTTGDIDDDFDLPTPDIGGRLDDRMDAPPDHYTPPDSTTPDHASDLTNTTGNPNAPGHANNPGNAFEPSSPRNSGTRARIRLPDLPDIDGDSGDSRRRRSGMFDREFEIDPASPEDIISGDALDLDDVDFEG